MVARQISFPNFTGNKVWKKANFERSQILILQVFAHGFASQSVYAGAFAWRPPSTKSSSPVIEDDWSEARKSITLATSSGSMAPVNGCSSVCLSKYWKTVYTYMYYECLSTAKHVWIYVHPVKHNLKNKTKEQKKNQTNINWKYNKVKKYIIWLIYRRHKPMIDYNTSCQYLFSQVIFSNAHRKLHLVFRINYSWLIENICPFKIWTFVLPVYKVLPSSLPGSETP